MFTEDFVTKLGVVGLPDTVIVDDDETGDSLMTLILERDKDDLISAAGIIFSARVTL